MSKSKIFRTRNLVAFVIGLLLFFSLQVCFFMHAFSARTITLDYLGRGVFSESQLSREEGFYSNGKDRWTFQIPKFEHRNRLVPPDAATNAIDTWVGTCELNPRSPWREIDVFGILGPFDCKVYGDWHVESSW